MNSKKNNSKTLSDKLERLSLSVDSIVAAFVSTFMLSYIFQLINNPTFTDLNLYYNSINFVLFWFLTIGGGLALCLFAYITKLKCLIPRTLIIITTLLSVMFAASYKTADAYFVIGLALVDFIIVLWCVKDDKLELSKINISYKTCLISACVLFILSSVIFSYYTSLKYTSFRNATFDFGIFSQMFENMAETGAPLTTVERSVEMSHFGVHFSPIYYLFLPGYMIFRSPIYLIVIQAVMVALGVFAVYLICKKLGLSGKVTLLFEVIYTFYPCLFNGCFYDFHENKFLTTIILFLLYFVISDKLVYSIGFSVLLLTVKEDAAIYLIAIALYVLISRKKYMMGSIMLGLSVIYFTIANLIVSSLGTEGVMMWRLDDYFVNGEESYFSVFKSILFDIGNLIKNMFTAEKFPFVIWMFLPLMFTPFMQKKISTLVLLLPIIPINLMQSWQYQYDINYQYTYGVAALTIFLAILGVKNLKGNTRRIALLVSLIVCLSAFASVIFPKISNNNFYDEAYGQNTDAIDEMLEANISREDSVTANHYIMPHLYYVREIYTVPEYYKEIEQTDFFVIDTRDNENTQKMMAVMGDDYVLVDGNSFVNVYKHR